VGGDALNPDPALNVIASTSRWVAADYARVGRFVADLGEAALDLLDPKMGERILDVGCGDGALTRKIVERGTDVVGVDNSPELVAAARAIGLEVDLIDAADMTFNAEFDAAFSNAALHWMLDKERVASATLRALKRGGRFAGEMGGEGNLAKLRETLDAEQVRRIVAGAFVFVFLVAAISLLISASRIALGRQNGEGESVGSDRCSLFRHFSVLQSPT